jgi:hypothetical protein
VLKATEVFTPGRYPSHTYVERANESFEARLRDALATPGYVISLSGPSKSGKTVLVERVVGENLIPITGAGVTDPSQLWDQVLDFMKAPSEVQKERRLAFSAEGGIEGSAGAGILFAKAEAKANAGVGVQRDRATREAFGRRGLQQVIEDVANSSFVILVDDFHYMPRTVQTEVAKQLKEAVRRGVKVCTASVPHRSDDVVRANPELRGRVVAVDLKYWQVGELLEISRLGFQKLRATPPPGAVDKLATESAGSPQLMQALCLSLCRVAGIECEGTEQLSLALASERLEEVLRRTAATTDFRSLVDVLDAGAKTRGQERKTYKFKNGVAGDVYRAILLGIAADPPCLSFDYDEIVPRVASICVAEKPVGSSIVTSCAQMHKEAEKKFPNERYIDWDEQKQVLDLPEPHLLFYLRWSGRLDTSEE